MMGNWPWYVWIAAAVPAVTALLLGALFATRAAWRASIRKEFLAYLEEQAPYLDIVAVRASSVFLKAPDDGSGVLHLHRLYSEASQLDPADSAGKEALFSMLMSAVHTGLDATSLDPVRDPDVILPRIVTESKLDALTKAAEPEPVPSQEVGVPGLRVVLVLDGDGSVRYLTDQHLRELGLSAEQAFAHARDNLRRSTPDEVFERTDGELALIKLGDTFDAARLLLASDYLEDGERIAALIPDRDTLALTALPENGALKDLRKLARPADGEPLYPEPIIVTRQGLEPAS